MYTKLIECIPNFSEGRDNKVINAISEAIIKVPRVQLLDVDSGANANRTVYTFVGEPSAVCEAAFQAAKVAEHLIDMSTQTGEHPRVGSLDVCPLVPISNVTIDEAVLFSNKLAQKISTELSIPTYLYEYSATSVERKNLAWIRKGQYESLATKMLNLDFKPDYGNPVFNKKSGISVVGARPFLIAYNINLNTKDVTIAKKIAAHIRETGSNGIGGTLKHVKAIGWYIKEFDKVQVSMNIIDYEKTPLWRVYEEIKKVSLLFGVQITGSELVGMLPRKAILETGIYFQNKNNLLSMQSNELDSIQYAVDYLKLDEVKEFNLKKKIIEYAINLS